ncbi:glycosyl hydrolase family 3 N terminal domain-containing protein [Apiospora kogelbergensis]|uniref:glycosyl hydrolase family 3 N terminal domain-containing protein n=1 Tax=Apiospora kogelbergensis TaxID=1337665 RepID=UPI0031323B2F
MKSLTTALCALLGQSTVTLGLQGYTNESEVPLYGLSPPVYPSPQGSGSTSSRWADAYARAQAIVAQATLEEKLNLTYGHPGQCVGNTGSIERLGVPALCFSDAPDGIRGNEFVSAFPAGIHVAATWDRGLMYKYGRALGDEYRGKGINVALGPVAGPLGRVVRGGRNWEGLSNDPYLAGAGMGTVVRGMQDAGVMANPKHWLLNEQEWRRLPNHLGESLSSNVDDRTLHELYVFPFMNGLKEGAVSVMCSYQRVNNSYGCQNSKMLNGILKMELGFEGFVLSDWDAQHAGVASANAGLDIVMPNAGYWGQNLTNAVNNGSVSAERANDMATRILAAWAYMNQDNGTYPAPGVFNNLQKHEPIDVQADHGALIREIGAAGTVLVKNVDNALPLRKPRFVHVIGYDAQVSAKPWQNPSRYGGGYEVNFGWETLQGTLVTGGGSGSSAPAYVVSPFDAIRERVVRDRGILRWDFESVNPTPYVNADACLVFINAYASESFDRKSLTDEFSDQLVKNTAANCTNTIVVIHSTGIRTVDAWIDHPNVTAVLYAGLPGQESGHSIVDVLWGDVAPSGKLPFTVAKKETDYGHLLNATVTFDAFPQQDFTEGLYIDYRAFDRDGVEPRYPFGHGLSYTTFAYDKLAVAKEDAADTRPLPDPAVPVVQGGHPALWDVVARVTCTVSNAGQVAAAEVAQLYIGIPSNDEFVTPVRQLRGFEKPGQTGTVTFPLTRRDLSVWDVKAQQWRLQAGSYKINVGASSRDIKLEGTLEIAA